MQDCANNASTATIHVLREGKSHGRMRTGNYSVRVYDSGDMLPRGARVNERRLFEALTPAQQAKYLASRDVTLQVPTDFVDNHVLDWRHSKKRFNRWRLL